MRYAAPGLFLPASFLLESLLPTRAWSLSLLSRTTLPALSWPLSAARLPLLARTDAQLVAPARWGASRPLSEQHL
jgi:hypothetical protein